MIAELRIQTIYLKPHNIVVGTSYQFVGIIMYLHYDTAKLFQVALTTEKDKK